MAFHSPSNCERNRKLVFEMVEAGESLTRIAAVVHTNRRHVKTFLKKNGRMRVFPYGRKAEKCVQWRGGRNVDQDGYVLVYRPGHPMARKPLNIYVLEHRLIMSEHLGRMLEKDEVVHHKNGNNQDNRLENLELFANNGKHLQKTIAGQVPNWTPDGIQRMKEGIARSAKMRRPHTRVLSARDVRPW